MPQGNIKKNGLATSTEVKYTFINPQRGACALHTAARVLQTAGEPIDRACQHQSERKSWRWQKEHLGGPVSRVHTTESPRESRCAAGAPLPCQRHSALPCHPSAPAQPRASCRAAHAGLNTVGTPAQPARACTLAKHTHPCAPRPLSTPIRCEMARSLPRWRNSHDAWGAFGCAFDESRRQPRLLPLVRYIIMWAKSNEFRRAGG